MGEAAKDIELLPKSASSSNSTFGRIRQVDPASIDAAVQAQPTTVIRPRALANDEEGLCVALDLDTDCGALSWDFSYLCSRETVIIQGSS